MMRIGLLSDTHGFLDPVIFDHFSNCDEVWHAGDFGSLELVKQLENFKPLKGVYGNIDDREVRTVFPLDLRFEMEGMDILMTHIGGYPGRYNRRVKMVMETHAPSLFICGHSHILKVIYDKKYQCLHMNPGACGHFGFHKIRTLLRFELHNGKVQNADVIELGHRGRLPG